MLHPDTWGKGRETRRASGCEPGGGAARAASPPAARPPTRCAVLPVRVRRAPACTVWVGRCSCACAAQGAAPSENRSSHEAPLPGAGLWEAAGWVGRPRRTQDQAGVLTIQRAVPSQTATRSRRHSLSTVSRSLVYTVSLVVFIYGLTTVSRSLHNIRLSTLHDLVVSVGIRSHLVSRSLYTTLHGLEVPVYDPTRSRSRCIRSHHGLVLCTRGDSGT